MRMEIQFVQNVLKKKIRIAMNKISKKKEVMITLLPFLMVYLTMIHLKRVRTSLFKHNYERKEASTPSLKTVHRTVFLTPSTTWSFSVVHKCTSSNSLLQLFLELLSSATGSSRSRHTFKSCHPRACCIKKKRSTNVLLFFLVRVTGLEPARR